VLIFSGTVSMTMTRRVGRCEGGDGGGGVFRAAIKGPRFKTGWMMVVVVEDVGE
jgi:hypothetical protein